MSKPIRVLHVIGIMNRGGAETMIMNLYRHIDRSKVQFDFVENSSEPAVFDEEILSLGGRIYRCPHYNVKNHFTYVKCGMTFLRHIRGNIPLFMDIWEALRPSTCQSQRNMGHMRLRTVTIPMRKSPYSNGFSMCFLTQPDILQIISSHALLKLLLIALEGKWLETISYALF